MSTSVPPSAPGSAPAKKGLPPSPISSAQSIRTPGWWGFSWRGLSTGYSCVSPRPWRSLKADLGPFHGYEKIIHPILVRNA